MNDGNARFVIAGLALAAGLAGGPAWADGPRAQVGVQVAASSVQVRHGGHRHHPPPRVHAPRHRFGASVIVAPVPLWGVHHPSWYYGAPYYGPPYWYAPPVVAVPTQPPVYIERAEQDGDAVYGTQPSAQATWYWCESPRGYYPTVPDCPGGWQPVAPRSTE